MVVAPPRRGPRALPLPSCFWVHSAVSLLAGRRAAAEAPRNCTLEPCSNAEDLCGEYRQDCHAVAGGGISVIWLQATFEFRQPSPSTPGSGVFRRVELGSFDLDACQRGDAWMQVTYEGRWSHRSDSTGWNGSSTAEVVVAS